MAKRPVPKYDFKAFGAAIKAAREERKESRKKVGDYYHAWEPLFSHLRATAIYGIITLESHHYI